MAGFEVLSLFLAEWSERWRVIVEAKFAKESWSCRGYDETLRSGSDRNADVCARLREGR